MDHTTQTINPALAVIGADIGKDVFHLVARFPPTAPLRSLGGWVTGGTAEKMVATSAQDASVLALTPLCVANGEQQPEQLVLLKRESSWSRSDFVTKAGWVANVNEKFRSAVASACASTLVEAIDAKPAG